jgi:hypothetical protein
MAVSFPAEPTNDIAFFRRHARGLLLANPPSLIGTLSCPEELPIASLLP